MPVTNRPSIRAFKAAIREAKDPQGREVNGRVTAKEMKVALKKLPETDAGVRAAQAMIDSSSVPLNGAAERALQAFIDKHAPTGPSQGTGVRTFGDAGELASALKSNPDFAEDVFRAAFGNSRSRSSSAEVVDVAERADGSFDVDVELVHWRTRSLMKEATVNVTAAGVIDSSAAPHMADPVAPAADTSAIEDSFQDTGHARRFAELALEGTGGGRLTRSDAVHVGEVTAGPMGSFFVDLQITNFMRPDDVKADLRLQLDSRGGFVKAFDRPSSSTGPGPAPSPGGGAAPVDAIRDRFSDTGALRRLAEDALGDTGLGRLTRSDAVSIDDVSGGPMGSFFVDVTVADFMRPDDVKARMRVQVNHAGDFVGASERALRR